MNRADRKRWAAARTLADLGELTALWLEGGIASQPGYAPGCGPDPETAALIGVLAACNRAGFLTDASQPGESSPGFDGAWWDQRAAVSGFASAGTVARLCPVIGARLRIQVHDAPRRRFCYRTAIPVTLREGQPYTRFGAGLPRRFLRGSYGECSRSAVREVCAAKQVTIVDPEPGRNDRLWPALERFARTTIEEAAS